MANTNEQTYDSQWVTPVVDQNTRVRAAVCGRCGVKIYPPSLLDLHQQRHQLKDRFLEEELKKLQSVFGRMR
jgi:hypothetical protein